MYVYMCVDRDSGDLLAISANHPQFKLHVRSSKVIQNYYRVYQWKSMASR